MTNETHPPKADVPLVRVLVVDDDPLARTGLSIILDAAGGIEVVADTGDEDKVVPLVLMHRPDVVLIDLRMPGIDVAALAAILRKLPHAPGMVGLTVVDDQDEMLGALEAGVRGLLPKASAPGQIAEAVREVACGGAALSPTSAMTLINQFVASRACPRRRHARTKLATLTARERQVVAAVAEGKSNAQIAAEMFLCEATVKTHITRTFAKLDATNRVHLAIFAYESGLAGCGETCRGPPPDVREWPAVF